MTGDEKREAVEKIIAAALNRAIGNSQPHMSGDPRDRLRPHWRRIVEDAAVSVLEIEGGSDAHTA
jgi:hypothetical protein